MLIFKNYKKFSNVIIIVKRSNKIALNYYTE